ncbi:MAG: hypothetical protein ACRD20_04845 [Terriglobales bacterium]
MKNQTVGALGALAMFAAVIVIGSCSRSSNPVAAQPQPLQPPVSTPAVTASVPGPIPAPPKTRAKKHRAATLAYVNREYGLSFKFPRNYQLNTASATAEAHEMNFVHSGGVTLAALEMPGNSYPGTDFKSASVNVSVNPGMTSEACSQFALPEAGAAADMSPAKIEQVKIGAIEFEEMENPGGAMMKQGNAKYYHLFGNGSCYEFALGIGTDSDRNVEEITPVDREKVFARLEKILATVTLQPAVMPETAAPVPAVASTAPADSSNAPEHEVTKPNL